MPRRIFLGAVVGGAAGSLAAGFGIRHAISTDEPGITPGRVPSPR
jgi:hypothetical protein